MRSVPLLVRSVSLLMRSVPLLVSSVSLLMRSDPLLVSSVSLRELKSVQFLPELI